ncbi:unnamed protein product [Lactuca virosa]|uniref:Ubiquitin-like protease family profile domain-containing protein n=1 Tax=Lactuca virosa TaxID=75947 RepID=A0AAU9LWZ5_9ASTR|nr:unnamed protein product [Lactuca virosa]
MYKSEIETSSTESGTNASSSQRPEIETSYMSNDTSRLVKKKKTTTKALVKRLLGVVADLTSKVDRVLQKKDEPDRNFEQDRGFREEEEEEEMINEEEEKKYYHDTHLHYNDISTHGLELQSTPKLKKITKAKKKKVVKSPEKANEDIVNEESNDVSNHLLLDSVEVTDAGWLISSHIAIWSALLMERRLANARWTIFPQELNLQNGKTFFLRNIANGVGGHPKWKDVDMVLFPINVPHAHWFLAVLHLDIWKVHIYDSARSMNFFTQYLTGGEFKSFGDSIISELDVIDY